MSTAPVTLDFSKTQPLQPSGGVTLDFSKAQPLDAPNFGVGAPPSRQRLADQMKQVDITGNPQTPESATAGLPGSSPNPQPATDAMTTAAELGIGAAGAYVGAPPLVQLMRAHPIVSSLALTEAQQIPGIVGRVAGKVPSWLPLLAGGKGTPVAPEDAEAGQGFGQPLLSAPQQPSGRLVLSPDEAAAQDQQMRLAQQMARQRGMQYAAGQKPDQ